MTKSKILPAGIFLAVAIVASLLIERRTRAKFHANDVLLQQKENQVARLAAENQRLANLIVQAKHSIATGDDRDAELAQLRAKVEVLRQQTNQLAVLSKQLAEER